MLAANVTPDASGSAAAFYTLLRIVLAALLLTAASAKAYLLTSSPASRSAWISMQVAAESFLALWLLIGAFPRSAWLAALATFCVFTAVAGVKVLRGSASCDCFGAASLSPRVMLIIDALAIAALLGTRPYVRFTRPTRSMQGDLLRLGTVALIVGVAALTLPFVLRPVPSPVLAAVLPTTRAAHGEADGPLITIGADEQTLNVGFVGKKAISRTRVRLSNTASAAVTVAEASTDCRCLRAAGLPLTVPAGGTREIEVQLEAPEESSNYAKQMTLTARDGPRSTVIIVHARVGLPLAVEPDISKLRDDADRSPDDLFVVVSNDGPDAVRLLYSTSANGTLVAVTPKESLKPGDRRKVSLRLLSQNVRPTAERVSIHTDSPDQPVLSFEVKF